MPVCSRASQRQPVQQEWNASLEAADGRRRSTEVVNLALNTLNEREVDILLEQEVAVM